MSKIIFEPDFDLYQTSSFYETLLLDENEKSKEKFIKDIERIVRTSLEYRNWIRYLKSEAKMSYCLVFNRLPEDLYGRLKIEMHHFPLTLYDIVEVILDKYLKTRSAFTRLSIANEVMENHFHGKVGIVPLTLTMHQLAHGSDKKFIRREDVYGDYTKFIRDYEIFLTDSAKVKLAHLDITTTEHTKAFHELYLELNPELLEEDDEPLPEGLEDLIKK